MLQAVSLLSFKREYFYIFFLLAFALTYSLLIEFNNYSYITKFDSQILNVTVEKQYQKTKLTKKGKLKSYQVLKLKSDNNIAFYSSCNKDIKLEVGQRLQVEVWARKISFYKFMSGFYVFSKILCVKKEKSLRMELNSFISNTHEEEKIAEIYKALFSATPLSKVAQNHFSSLGISHLLAISGFHLGVLSWLLFFLLKYPYKFLQDKYFPYRSYSVDSFVIIGTILLFYLLFLNSPPSLLRAYVMLIIGFFLYNRGMKIVSMLTLLLTVVVLLVLFPRLFFLLGFWLSVAGVFYIFLFLIYYKELNTKIQFFLVPFIVYFLMLPYSLVIFANFSFYHPLSIVWSMLFSLFYPLSLFLHLIGQGDLLDFMLNYLLNIETNSYSVSISFNYLALYIILSFGAIFSKKFFYALVFYALMFFFYAFF